LYIIIKATPNFSDHEVGKRFYLIFRYISLGDISILFEGIFSQVWELACANELRKCAGSSLVAGRGTHARLVS
jgi:hypothetical protein